MPKITGRMNIEKELHFSNRLLEISNRHRDMSMLLNEYVKEVRGFIKCSAVGARLLDEDGTIPFKAHEGFSRTFFNSEDLLSITKDKCICIDVSRKKNPSDPACFTCEGVFYSNSMNNLGDSHSSGKILNITGEAMTKRHKPYVRITFYDKGSSISGDIINKVRTRSFLPSPMAVARDVV